MTSCDSAEFEGSDHVPYKDIKFFDQPLKHLETMPEVKRIGHALFSLPLNGKWIDLSVTFTILQWPEFIALELNEIHIF